MSTVLGGVFGVGGAALLLYALVMVMSQVSFAARSDTVTGTVVALQAAGTTPSDMSESGMTYCPVVRFADREGREVEFQSKVGYSPPRHHPGDKLTVQYDPRHPERARVFERVSLVVPVVLAFVAAVFLGFAFVFAELT